MPSRTDTSAPRPPPPSEGWPPFTLPLTDLVAGSAAGSAQVLVGQPLDTIKVRAQTAAVGRFTGPMDVLRQTLRHEGLGGLYKGITPPLVGVAAQTSILFTAFNLSKRLVSPLCPSNLSVSQIALAGGIAGGVNTVLSAPIELVKIRQQSNYDARSASMLSVFNSLRRDVGWKSGVYRGFWITFWREIPAYSAFYAAFEASKRAFAATLHPSSSSSSSSHLDAPASIPIWALMLSGSAGGIANWLASYPLDVVKSRVQLSDEPLARGGIAGSRYIAHQTAHIYRTEGPRAFVRGLSPTLLRAIPAAAATFTTFELVKRFLDA
ncbi:uncharacterized protein PFL1_05791 [Pseudozyma flocculosa PF-1]|uniref:Mitochondrial carrier protein n=2 Tax=Pseudozyma flocculosa TaxID=84751 RepID=A0A061H2V9_9BASI|nr:uncharacterized protein PFL1_05791 [Pseudozyma flocculosa PF-1]EPQ26813.1 hypothetical protein PFL1_05791 [Pseudozyma flocculosa PF-1]SPO40855.1 related to YMC1 - putative mitochondrial inner membrane transporter [Pseudozyma flocculosa]